MNNLTFLKLLFEGYINCFGSHRWYTNMTYTDITQLEIEHFRKLGLMLGYLPVREWNKDGHARDLVWLINNYPSTPNEVFLHLERENKNSAALSCINDPNNKLRNSAKIDANRNLIGIFGWVTQGIWNDCCNYVKNNKDYKDTKVLLIGGIGNNQDSVLDIQAMIWENNSALYREAKFFKDDGLFWYANFTSKGWHP